MRVLQHQTDMPEKSQNFFGRRNFSKPNFYKKRNNLGTKYFRHLLLHSFLILCYTMFLSVSANNQDHGASSVGSDKLVYRNDFEEKCDLSLWTSSCEIEINTLALSDNNVKSGRKSAKCDFTVTRKGRHIYFSLPVDIPFAEDEEEGYFLDADIWVDAPEYLEIALGIGVDVESGSKKSKGLKGLVDIVTPVVIDRNKWVNLKSQNLSHNVSNLVKSFGNPGSKGAVRKIFISIYARHIPAGERVVVYLDNVSVVSRKVKVEDNREKADKLMKEVGYKRPPPYDLLENNFFYGVTTGETNAAFLGVSDKVRDSLMAHHWTMSFFDTVLVLGGFIKASDNEFDKLETLLDLHEKHGFRVIPSTYMTGYYEPQYPRTGLEEKISKLVTRFQDHPALGGWYVLDEPRHNQDILINHWLWIKRIIESLDSKHPVMASFNNLTSVKYFTPYSVATIINWYPLSRRVGPEVHRIITGIELCKAAREAGADKILYLPQAYAARYARLPSAAEMRLQVYGAAAFGLSGLLYYNYFFRPIWVPAFRSGELNVVDIVLRPRGGMGTEIMKLGKIIPVIAPLMLKTTWEASNIIIDTEPVQGFDFPALEAQLNRGKEYDIMVVYNRDVKNIKSGVVQLPEELAGEKNLYDLHEQKKLTLDKRSFSINLQPGDGRFLAWASDKTAQKLFSGIDKLHYEKLHRVYKLLFSEAQAWDITLTEVTLTEKEASAQAQGENYKGALARLQRAVNEIESALDKDKKYSSTRRKLSELQITISQTNATFEKLILAKNWMPNSQGTITDIRGEYSPYSELLLELAKFYWRLEYGLRTGQLDDSLKAYPKCTELANIVNHYINELTRGNTPVIRGDVRKLVNECNEITELLELK